jgi:hypothetical protein
MAKQDQDDWIRGGGDEQARIASFIAMVVRNKMEDFHCAHLGDAQMKELNPIIRNAIYEALHVLANSSFNTVADEYLSWSVMCIPPYWEKPALSPGYAQRFEMAATLAQLRKKNRAARIAVVGSRDYPDLHRVGMFVWSQREAKTVIISGGARGVDQAAVAQAKKDGIPYEEYPADWKAHGKAAGMIRNGELVEKADVVVAFWDEASRGTKNTIERAKAAGKLLGVYGREGQLIEPV